MDKTLRETAPRARFVSYMGHVPRMSQRFDCRRKLRSKSVATGDSGTQG